MIAIDEVQALFSKSEYLTPTGGAVESYHLSTPRLFLDYLMGKETLVGHRCPSHFLFSFLNALERTAPAGRWKASTLAFVWSTTTDRQRVCPRDSSSPYRGSSP